MNGQEFHSSRCRSLCASERRVDRSALIIHCLLRVKHTAYQFSNTFRSSLGRCYKSTLAPRTLPCKAIQFQFVCPDVFDLPLKQARFFPIFLPTLFLSIGTALYPSFGSSRSFNPRYSSSQFTKLPEFVVFETLTKTIHRHTVKREREGRKKREICKKIYPLRR